MSQRPTVIVTSHKTADDIKARIAVANAKASDVLAFVQNACGNDPLAAFLVVVLLKLSITETAKLTGGKGDEQLQFLQELAALERVMLMCAQKKP